MTTARAAVFAGAGRPLEFREFELPALAGAEVLVRVLGCTLCGSDVHTFEGRRQAPVPTILGHEIIGQIEEFGPVVQRQDATGAQLQVGDRVTWAIVASCGDCFYCLRDLPQKCERMVKYGHEPLHPGRELTGGLAEFCVLAPGTAIIRLPDTLPLDVACPASCATATVTAALDAAGDVEGRSVLIAGAGMLGLTACAMSRSRGAAEVLCVDINPLRLAQSESFGATRRNSPDELNVAVPAATGGYGVDVVLELSGSPAAFESSFPHVQTGGTLVLVGAVFPSKPVALAMEQVVRRQLTLRGVHNYAPRHLQAAVNFLTEQHRYPFDQLVSRWLPLSDAEEAFALAANPESLRIGINVSAGIE